MKRSHLKVNPEKVKAWQQRSRKPLHAHKRLTAKKSIRKVGKIGRANISSRIEIGKRAEALGLTRCELGPVLLNYGINVCLYNFALAPAHRHKRAWYKGDAEKLADIQQWVAACQCCHDVIEHNAELTEQVFIKLRGKES